MDLIAHDILHVLLRTNHWYVTTLLYVSMVDEDLMSA